jgi:hypothetical protein
VSESILFWHGKSQLNGKKHWFAGAGKWLGIRARPIKFRQSAGSRSNPSFPLWLHTNNHLFILLHDGPPEANTNVMRIEFKRHHSIIDGTIGKEVRYMAAWRYSTTNGTAIGHILAAFQESSHYGSNFNVTMKLRYTLRWGSPQSSWSTIGILALSQILCIPDPELGVTGCRSIHTGSQSDFRFACEWMLVVDPRQRKKDWKFISFSY